MTIGYARQKPYGNNGFQRSKTTTADLCGRGSGSFGTCTLVINTPQFTDFGIPSITLPQKFSPKQTRFYSARFELRAVANGFRPERGARAFSLHRGLPVHPGLVQYARHPCRFYSKQRNGGEFIKEGVRADQMQKGKQKAAKGGAGFPPSLLFPRLIAPMWGLEPQA